LKSHLGTESGFLYLFGVTVLVLMIILSSAGWGIMSENNANSNAGIVEVSSRESIVNPPYSSLYPSNGDVKSDSFVYSNFSLSLGSVTSSYLENIYVPVYTSGGRNFTGLIQVFSYNPSLLKFMGIVNDVSSQNVTFSSINLTEGVVKVYGNGTFLVFPYRTILFYLSFSPQKTEQIRTEVLLDYSILGSSFSNDIESSSIELARGWTSIGPSDIPFNFQGNESSYTGLGSGFTNPIGFSPYFMNTIYAAAGGPFYWSMGGLMKTNDGGLHWENIDLGLEYPSVTSIWVDPSNPDIVVVISNGEGYAGGIFKTVNGGLSWQEVYPGYGNNLQYVAGNGLYAFMKNSVILSTDLGTTWKIISVRDGTIYYGLVLHNGSTIEISQSNLSNTGMEIFVSDNGGITYNTGGQIYSIPYTAINLISDPSNSSIQWMNDFGPGYNNDSLFKSVNGGLTWRSVSFQSIGIAAFDTGACPQVITYDPSNSSIMYLGGETYVAKSTNGGASFQDLHNISTSPYGIFVDPLNDSTIFVDGEQGLFVTHNGGMTWATLNNRSCAIATGVSVDGSNYLAALEQFGPVASNDNGSSWYTLPLRPKGPGGSILRWEGGVTSVDPYNSSIVIYAAGGMVISHNGGLTYTVPKINQTGVDNQNISGPNAFAFVPDSETIFYAGGAGVYISSNNGYSWNLINDSPVYCSAIAGATINGTFLLYASNYSGLFLSDDMGNSWTKLGNYYLKSISIDPENTSIIAGTILNEVVISHDSGRDFIRLNESPNSTYFSLAWWYPKVVYQSLSNGSNILYYASFNGVFASLNNGLTWKDVSYNIQTPAVISINIYGNSTYVTTLGQGVLSDPSLYNMTFRESKPILSGYLPRSSSVTIDGNNISGQTYFSTEVNSGINSILYRGEEINLTFSYGAVYFLNFSNMLVSLNITQRNLPPGYEWNISANGRIYSIRGNGSLMLPLGTEGIYVLPFAAEYSIYYPSNNFYPLNSSLVSSITVQFETSVRSINRNFSSSMNGMFWSTQIAYSRGYILYAGGTLGLLNTSTNRGSILNIPDYSGLADTVLPFQDGFLIGGSSSPKLPGIYYYNISSGLSENYSSILPNTWRANYSMISWLSEINSSAFLFIGGGENSFYLGMIYRGIFTDLSDYIPSYFTPSDGSHYRYSGAYLSSYNAFVLSDGNDIGILYLKNKTFQDISALMPNGFFIGMGGNDWSPSSDFISSNSTTAVITGYDSTGQFTVLFTPGLGIKDISDLFPTYEYMDTVTWHGKCIIISGHESNGHSSPIYIYNTSRGIATAINTSYYGNTSMIDSAIMVGNSLYFTTFNIKTVPNESYVIFLSYYGEMSLTPTGSVNIRVNTPASIEIGNETYYSMNVSIPEFAGNYTLTISSPGYVSYVTGVEVRPFESLYLNVTLEAKTYGVTFSESGLPSGTSWSVTLNGTTESSSHGNITFERPNGTYEYAIDNSAGYRASPSSGNITVIGSGVDLKIVFTPVTYAVTFIQSGLPSGTLWFVNLTNGQSFHSSSNSINFNEPNGSYQYIVATIDSNYTPVNHSGSFHVRGSNLSIAITFSPVTYYSVLFTENGLPSGKWYVNITGMQSSGPIQSSQTSYSISLPNGSYSYSVSTGNKIYRPFYTDSFTVSGAPVSQSISFKEVTYSVTFTQSGLPSGTKWYINLSNGQSLSSDLSIITFSEPNGTYSYTVSSSNKIYAPITSSGVFSVYGATVRLSINFIPVTYKITFTESGLSSGTWYVTLNGITESSSSSTITFNEPNGSYSYSIQGISGYRANNYSGTIYIDGNPAYENITWSIILYPITIKENGIPNGTQWSVTLTGTAFNGNKINITLYSTTDTITFNEPNGSYAFRIHLPSGYSSSSINGTVNVSGVNVNARISAEKTPGFNTKIDDYAIIALLIIAIASASLFTFRRRK